MKLYIFRCRTRPKLYGATRYETASNLPTSKCSGWEFHERVDLKPDGRLRFAVDTDTVRRQVEQRGWHVWDETPWEARNWEARNEERASGPPAVPRRPVPLEPEALELEEQTEEVSTQAEESVLPSAVGQESPAESSPVLESDRVPEPSEPTLPRRERPPVKPEPSPLEKPARPMRKETAEPATQFPPPQRPAAEPRIGGTAVVPAVSKKAAPPPVTAARPAPAVSPARPAAPKLSTRHQVVWFDIPVRDIDRAMRFYSAVLGTALRKEQAGPGVAIAVLPHAEGAIGGSLVQNIDARPSDGGPMLYLNTQGRLDEATKAAAAHGGKVLAEKHSIAPFGFRAIVLDCEGNRIALHSD